MPDAPEPSTEVSRPPPSALLVGVADELVVHCGKALSPLRILRAKDPAAACERILTARPLLVVVVAHPQSQSQSSRDMEELVARAYDVSALVIKIGASAQPEHVVLQLRSALKASVAPAATEDEIEIDIDDVVED